MVPGPGPGGAAEGFRAQHAPRRTIHPADSARLHAAVLAAEQAQPATAHGTAVLDCVRTGYAKGWDAAVAAERAHLVRLRHTPEARAKLAAFLTKS